MLLLTVIILPILASYCYGDEISRDMPELPVPDMIRYWGYPVEEHWVTTEDGYIIGLHRIPRGRYQTDKQEGSKPVVYLQHGLTSSSSQWTFGPPDKSIGFVLADAGYDVWMGNSRGNSYSRNHTTLEPCSFERCKEFWDFGWHEGGLYDVSAGIDYVLAATEQSKVNYVGHSMGCTQYLVLMSSRPEYNEKINVGILLAPPAYMAHGTSVIFQLAQWGDGIDTLYHLFGLYEFLPHLEIISMIGHMFCSDEHPDTQDLCLNIGLVLLGYNPNYMNASMIPVYLDHVPEGTSTRPFVHYAQLFLSGNFESYDYGELDNIEHYGQPTPLEYDLTNVVAPTAIFKADHDDLVNLLDVDKLVNHLPNVVYDHLVERDGFTHFDYALATDADDHLYPFIFDLLSQYNH